MVSVADMKTPGLAIVPQATHDELQMVLLAREIAIGLKPIPDILKSQGVDQAKFEALKKNERFVAVLASEIAAWNGATNTYERVKLKSASMIEEWLPELYSRMNDREENLNAKVEAGKLVKDLAGLGVKADINGARAGDRVSITINLGNDVKLEYQNQLPEQVIDVTPNTLTSPDPVPEKAT